MIIIPSSAIQREYYAEVLRVLDGDTIDVLINVGFNIFLQDRIRLYGVNTPETRTKDLKEKAAGMKAKQFVVSALFCKKIKIRTIKKGKYGRYLAMVYIPTASNNGDYCDLNNTLLLKGLATEYYGGKR